MKLIIAVFSLQGLGTNDDTLIRIIVSRSEIDMVQITQAFHRLCGKQLSDWITVTKQLSWTLPERRINT